VKGRNFKGLGEAYSSQINELVFIFRSYGNKAGYCAVLQ
jgi:hypothetical protein